VLDEFAAHVDAVAGGVGVMAPGGRRAATGNTAVTSDERQGRDSRVCWV
jgi:hypothetical protein